MSRKKFDNATAAAAKFITLPDEAQKKPEATEEPAKKRGRPKKSAYETVKEAEKEAEKNKTDLEKSVDKIEQEIQKKKLDEIRTRSKPQTMTAEPKLQRKSDRKKPFSAWMDTATADEVKLYSAITGEKMTDILEAAVKEYLKNHELTAEQKEAYKKRERERINNI